MRPNVVLFGDSITEQSFRSGGWGASLSNTYSRKADVLNRGYGGYNTRWALFLLHHIFPLGSATPPAAATIFFGANDAAISGRTSERQHVPVSEYKENLKNIVQHLKECSSSMLIVLITPPPIDEEGRFQFARSLHSDNAMKLPERTNEVAGIYAEECLGLARQLDLPSINLWSKMQEIEGWQKKFLRDGLHLTQEGNEVVYQEVVRVFEESGFIASKMAYDFPHHSEIDSKNPEKAFQLQQCLGVERAIIPLPPTTSVTNVAEFSLSEANEGVSDNVSISVSSVYVDFTKYNLVETQKGKRKRRRVEGRMVTRQASKSKNK